MTKIGIAPPDIASIALVDAMREDECRDLLRALIYAMDAGTMRTLGEKLIQHADYEERTYTEEEK